MFRLTGGQQPGKSTGLILLGALAGPVTRRPGAGNDCIYRLYGFAHRRVR
jgi:hypothetical protein